MRRTKLFPRRVQSLTSPNFVSYRKLWIVWKVEGQSRVATLLNHTFVSSWLKAMKLNSSYTHDRRESYLYQIVFVDCHSVEDWVITMAPLSPFGKGWKSISPISNSLSGLAALRVGLSPSLHFQFNSAVAAAGSLQLPCRRAIPRQKWRYFYPYISRKQPNTHVIS